MVALSLNSLENALVVCVDEKPHIQALQRAQGYLRMPDGRAAGDFSHSHKRHGTTTLLAALDIVTCEVQTGHFVRRRRREFLDFRNEVVASNPGREIHMILGNLNTHQRLMDRLLQRHPQAHLHFTPTNSTWLNEVECGFSILSRAALRGASFTSNRQLRQAIDKFVAAYNADAAPL